MAGQPVYPGQPRRCGRTGQDGAGLHEAEETRDQAITYLQQREAELTNQIAQTEAELNAAMDGLRSARGEAEELRAWIERHNQV